MNGIEIRQYVDLRGRNHFERWLLELDDGVQARVLSIVYRIEQGNFSGVKGVGSGVFELRINFGPGYRVYLGKDGERIVILLSGGTKRRQQADIEMALGLWQEYKQTKRGYRHESNQET